MDTDKQQLADNIKRLVADLNLALEKARSAGLTVEVSNRLSLHPRRPSSLTVEVWEKTAY